MEEDYDQKSSSKTFGISNQMQLLKTLNSNSKFSESIEEIKNAQEELQRLLDMSFSILHHEDGMDCDEDESDNLMGRKYNDALQGIKMELNLPDYQVKNFSDVLNFRSDDIYFEPPGIDLCIKNISQLPIPNFSQSKNQILRLFTSDASLNDALSILNSCPSLQIVDSYDIKHLNEALPFLFHLPSFFDSRVDPASLINFDAVPFLDMVYTSKSSGQNKIWIPNLEDYIALFHCLGLYFPSSFSHYLGNVVSNKKSFSCSPINSRYFPSGVSSPDSQNYICNTLNCMLRVSLTIFCHFLPSARSRMNKEQIYELEKFFITPLLCYFFILFADPTLSPVHFLLSGAVTSLINLYSTDAVYLAETNSLQTLLLQSIERHSSRLAFYSLITIGNDRMTYFVERFAIRSLMSIASQIFTFDQENRFKSICETILSESSLRSSSQNSNLIDLFIEFLSLLRISLDMQIDHGIVLISVTWIHRMVHQIYVDDPIITKQKVKQFLRVLKLVNSKIFDTFHSTNHTQIKDILSRIISYINVILKESFCTCTNNKNYSCFSCQNCTGQTPNSQT